VQWLNFKAAPEMNQNDLDECILSTLTNLQLQWYFPRFVLYGIWQWRELIVFFSDNEQRFTQIIPEHHARQRLVREIQRYLTR
jgi:hypothetical protein